MGRILLLLALFVGAASVRGETGASTASGVSLADRRLLGLVQDQRALEADVASGGVSEEQLLLRAQELVTAYESFVRDNPDHLYGWILFGKFLYETGKEEESLRAFLQADSLDPGIATVKQYLGNILADQGEYRPAAVLLLQAVDLAPDTARHHYDLGSFLETHGSRLEEDGVLEPGRAVPMMREAFANAHRLKPEDIDLAMRWAQSLTTGEPEDWEGALEAWQAAGELADSPIEAEAVRLQVARALIELGRPAEAARQLGPVETRVFENNRRELIDRLPPEHRPDPGDNNGAMAPPGNAG